MRCCPRLASSSLAVGFFLWEEWGSGWLGDQDYTKIQGVLIYQLHGLSHITLSELDYMFLEGPGRSVGRLKRRRPIEILTKHLDIVEDDSCPRIPNPIVGHTAVGARVLLAGSVNKQVTQQEASLVVGSNAGPILGPRDSRWRDSTGHTLQYETLAFGDNDSLGFQWVDDAGSLSSGPWSGDEGQSKMWTSLSLSLMAQLQKGSREHGPETKQSL